MTRGLRGAAAPLYLLLFLIFGGASARAVEANAALQIVAALVLIGTALFWKPATIPAAGRVLLVLSFALLALAALQLVPLPPSLWGRLPGRETLARGFDLLEFARPPLAFSMTPDATITSVLALLPPVAMLLLLWRRKDASANLWPVLIVVFVVVSILLGLAQKFGGRTSPLYFYSFTSWGAMVGFFANANHLVTLLLAAVPFIAFLAAPVMRQRKKGIAEGVKLLCLGVLTLMIGGSIAADGSRAGAALFPVIVAMSACMIRMDITGRLPRLWLILVGVLSLGGVAALSQSKVIVDEAVASQAGVPGTSRRDMWERTGDMISASMPVGTGIGSFVSLYRLSEDPRATTRTFVNHAHNDYLEWTLETGIPGLILLGSFFFWWIIRLRRIWSPSGLPLGRAASIASAVVMLHSFVDYPIRTAAIAVLFALCCGLMALDSAPRRKGKSS